MSVPATQKSWILRKQEGFESLELNTAAEVPKVGENDVLVKMRGASLNYRDLIITKNMYPLPMKPLPLVPGSDGAGEVVEVGSKVTRFQKGDKVVTLFNQGWIGGEIVTMNNALGGSVDGTLREYGVFNEEGLVHMPETLNFLEAATLPCAALTAWNGLYGLTPLKPGQTVLTQGTGGVSIFAVQFAVAAGATAIATTSSQEKADLLKKLGAHHVINYKETPEWGALAKSLTPGGAGVDHIIEVGGPTTMQQSLAAIKYGGIISIIGFVGGNAEKQPSFLEALTNCCTVRGLLVGSRIMFEDMNRAIDANKIKPVVDKAVFKLENLRDAYQYQWDQKHFGKVAIEIN